MTRVRTAAITAIFTAGRNRLPARDPRGEDRRQLLFALQPGQGDEGADEQAYRDDHRQKLRNREQGQLDHDPDALTAFDDNLELIQALAQDADSGQRGARSDDRAGDLAKKIALNQRHMRRKSPVAGGGWNASNTHPHAPATVARVRPCKYDRGVSSRQE